MNVHKGEGSGSCGRMWTGERIKNLIFCGRHKWMAPKGVWRVEISDSGWDAHSLVLCFPRYVRRYTGKFFLFDLLFQVSVLFLN